MLDVVDGLLEAVSGILHLPLLEILLLLGDLLHGNCCSE